MTELCSSSIKLERFWDSCKIARIKPLFRKGSKTNPSNQRPISLLPLISKTIKKRIHEQASSFLTNNEILYNYQSGFRKSHFTDSCLTFLHNEILKGFDKNLITGMKLITPNLYTESQLQMPLHVSAQLRIVTQLLKAARLFVKGR